MYVITRMPSIQVSTLDLASVCSMMAAPELAAQASYASCVVQQIGSSALIRSCLRPRGRAFMSSARLHSSSNMCSASAKHGGWFRPARRPRSSAPLIGPARRPRRVWIQKCSVRLIRHVR